MRGSEVLTHVLCFLLLSGKLPYGVEVAKSRTRSAQNKLMYDSVLHDDREIPVWIDGALAKAVQANPLKRYETLTEFIYDLRHPNPAFLGRARPPLIEQHPVMFWKGLSLLLAVVLFALLVARFGVR